MSQKFSPKPVRAQHKQDAVLGGTNLPCVNGTVKKPRAENITPDGDLELELGSGTGDSVWASVF